MGPSAIGVPPENHVADVHCITDGLEWQRVFGEPRDQVESGAIDEGEHQVLIGKPEARPRGSNKSTSSRRVDGTHAAYDEAPAREHPANRHHHHPFRED